MKTDYEIIIGSLNDNMRAAFSQFPDSIFAPLNEGPQLLESNEALSCAVAEFLPASIKAAPYMVRQTAERLVKFFVNAKELGRDYFVSSAAADDFKAKFKVGLDAQPDAQPANEAQRKKDKALSREALLILRQLLFRSFFSMLTPNRRERLIKFMEKNELCDETISEELHARINDAVDRDERKIEGLLLQVEKGGMNCFLWLHQMLFDFFNGIMSAEEKSEELDAKLAEERKRKIKTAPLAQSLQNPPEEQPKDMSRIRELELENNKLSLEIQRHDDELRRKDEMLALKLEAQQAKFGADYEKQISALKTQNQAFEEASARLADESARKAKLSAHAFETFLETLPQKYSAPGYAMLRSIVNEWDGDLQSVQNKERKYAFPAEMKLPRKEGSNLGKTFMWIAIIAGFLASGVAIYLWAQQRRIQLTQTVGAYAPVDLSRLASLKLETLEDLNQAFDTLKPHATIDEIRFLNARQQAIQNAKLAEGQK